MLPSVFRGAAHEELVIYLSLQLNYCCYFMDGDPTKRNIFKDLFFSKVKK